MRIRCLFVCIAFLGLAVSAQDWQNCKPEGDYSFSDVKAAVHRVTSSQGYSGWDVKTFNRSGDLVAVAVLKTLDDSDMTYRTCHLRTSDPSHGLRLSQYCVKVTDDRRPRKTLLLLEHLKEIPSGKMTPEIEEAKLYILQQASKANYQMEGSFMKKCRTDFVLHRKVKQPKHQ